MCGGAAATSAKMNIEPMPAETVRAAEKSCKGADGKALCDAANTLLQCKDTPKRRLASAACIATVKAAHQIMQRRGGCLAWLRRRETL